jgi:hypothetical protein
LNCTNEEGNEDSALATGCGCQGRGEDSLPKYGNHFFFGVRSNKGDLVDHPLLGLDLDELVWLEREDIVSPLFGCEKFLSFLDGLRDANETRGRHKRRLVTIIRLASGDRGKSGRTGL